MEKYISIKEIDRIDPIPGKDNIEMAILQGRTVVVDKGDFEAGDLCILAVPGCFFPVDDPRFAFLINPKGSNRVRIKNGMDSNGVSYFSYGVIFPLSILTAEENRRMLLGEDLDSILEVSGTHSLHSMVPPVSLGPLPKHVPLFNMKTIQDIPWVISKGACTGLEMLDGLVTSYSIKRNSNGWDHLMCSKTKNLRLNGKDPYSRMAKENKIFDVLEQQVKVLQETYKDDPRFITVRNLTIQGFICGPDIKGNSLALSEMTFFGYSLIMNRFLLDPLFSSMLANSLHWCPFLDHYDFKDGTVNEAITASFGASSINASRPRSGVIYYFNPTGETAPKKAITSFVIWTGV